MASFAKLREIAGTVIPPEVGSTDELAFYSRKRIQK